MCTAASPAGAEPMVGIVGGEALITFDSANPGVVTSTHGINGLAAGPAERVVGIDFRNGDRLYALTAVDGGATDTLRLYTIDPGNGNATVIGAPFNIPHGNAYGVDFNPVADRLRVVNDADKNLRVNPATGVQTVDTDLSPAASGVTAVAYDPAAKLYGIATTPATLVTLANPNTGLMTTIGPLGLGAFGGAETANFDISPSGTGYVTTRTASLTVPYLSRVDLATGALTPIGRTATALEGLAVVPPATVSFGVAAATVSEGAGTATISVVRGGTTTGTTLVNYTAGDVTGPLLFEPGETVKSFSVPIANDTLDAPDRTITLSLRPADALTTAGANATLTVADDDPARDTTAPAITLTAPKTVKLAEFLKGLKVKVTAGEPVSLDVTLEGTVNSARISAYNVALAKQSLVGVTGARSITLKPAKKVVGKPRKTVKVRVRVVAADAAGNRTTTTRTVSVKPR
ncbi:DUF4394 domain-containing protein [Solirubrobacter soli]|uniref:DUF4394 domain-containing protein n=1 Tax=Solirubrobacter soli TaxID=363832 RepID=UPI0004815887|nr:DUF4394 domain-containing protein [Solirubrobacter soli]